MTQAVWFETHAHLSDPQFDSDRNEVLTRAAQARVETLVEIADGPAEWAKARHLSESHPEMVWWAAGLHPYYADQGSDTVWAELKNCAAHPRFVAVGEVGLDYAKCTIPKDVQINSFNRALDISREVNKPLIIHCREAYSDLLPILRKVFKNRMPGAPVPGVVHCFSGGRAEAEELTQMGFYLGVDAPITYPKAQSLRDALAAVPLERLVLETDSPYLPPQTHRGKRNEPFHIPAIGQALAHILHLPTEQVAEQTTQNSFSLFRLNPSR